MAQQTGGYNMTINTNTLIGGGGLPQLAPDLTYPGGPIRVVTGIDGSGGLATALSLTGKWAISYLRFINMGSEATTLKLTVDSVVIWNSSFTSGGTLSVLGSTTAGISDIPISCDASFLLEIQVASDADIDLNYIARPIL